MYNWRASYSQAADPARLRDRERPGRPPSWTEQSEALLVELIAVSPDQVGYLAVNWSVPLLQEQLEPDTRVHFSMIPSAVPYSTWDMFGNAIAMCSTPTQS